VDVTPPVITGLEPSGKINISKATIRARISGYDTVELLLDGKPVTNYLLINGKLVYVIPSADLKYNEDMTAKLTVSDNGGNTVTKSVTFNIEQYREGFGFGRVWFE
jgi:hypothetical protein